MDRTHINNLVISQTGMLVQAGPFAGMRLLRQVSWMDGDISPKLLGTYEEELHPVLRRFASRQYSAIVNIGCAEGYYAVGAALLFQSIPVYAFDSNEDAGRIAREAAELNGVGERVVIGGSCEATALCAIANKSSRLLVICDCEGYEATLFTDPAVVQSVRSSDLIIECHDFIDPRVTPWLMWHLHATHKVQLVYASGRNPNVFPFLAKLSDVDRWLSVCEMRPCLMHWLVAEAMQPNRAMDQA